ncbi:MAG: hypothetical protein R8M38_06030 [Mariprofundaceae bacterium]
MSSLVISFTMYFVVANIVFGTFYMFGKDKYGFLAVEYPFIYMPWLALQLITPSFVNLPLAETDLAFKYFLFMMQGIGCGVIGGGVLFPRLFFIANSAWQKLRITIISSVVMAMLYLASRAILLELFRYIFA